MTYLPSAGYDIQGRDERRKRRRGRGKEKKGEEQKKREGKQGRKRIKGEE